VTKDGFIWTLRDSVVFQHPLLKTTCHVDFCFNTRSVYLNLVKNKRRIDVKHVASFSYLCR